MKIRAPMHSVDARGRFGSGVVMSIWRGLNYARIFTLPTNPRSTRQIVIRGLMTSASRAWNALTDANRVTWKTYSEAQSRKNVFGKAYDASGFNEYCALYVLASDIGETPPTDGPTVPGPLIVTDGAIVEGTLEGEIDVTWTAGQAGFMDAWITALLPDGRAPKESDYKHQSYTADATETLTIDGLTPDAKYSVRIRQIFLSGQPGPWTVETLKAKESA